ncbi:MAG: tetraacyldisaccharide 4'-kinase [Candidatus Omnitrophica bacterium]|nr:tetraacyldisaccharide 4'-kinase [Candidatus Omnitrophota bacterium]
MKNKIKMSYIRFVEEDKHSFLGKILYGFLYCLSLVYGVFIEVRNFIYNKGIANSYNPDSSFLIGIGNISWAGTGKTPFCLWLYKRLNIKFKTGILRRGYGEDEKKLIKKECDSVFSSPDRLGLVKSLEKDYDLFILDDSFQYRKLKKDLEIVIMGQREFNRKVNLIPASFFREPFKSIKRVDILVVNYKEEVDRDRIKEVVCKVAPLLKVYFANYQIKGLENLEGKKYDLNFLKDKKIAAFAAIGYPQGFFDLLKKTGAILEKEIRYPDHYSLSGQEYSSLEKKLKELGIDTLVITGKDKYHLPKCQKEIDIFILDVKLEVEAKEKMIEDIIEKINNKLN